MQIRRGVSVAVVLNGRRPYRAKTPYCLPRAPKIRDLRFSNFRGLSPKIRDLRAPGGFLHDAFCGF